MKNKKRKNKRGGKILSLIAFAAVLCAGLLGYDWLRSNRMPGFTAEKDVYVHPGDSLEGIKAQLLDCGPKSKKVFFSVLEEKQVEKYLTPGHYIVKPSYSYVYVARMLNNGWQSPVRLNLNGGLRLKSEIAHKISSQLLLSYSEVLGCLNDEKFLASYGFTPESVYALFMPDTYELWWDCSAADLFSHMKKEYNSFWNSGRVSLAKKVKLSPIEVATLASIVNCESNHVPEYPKIAGVYINRMRAGQRLQACPTVAFCYDFKLNRILSKHLQVESPYNTYRHKGLPPGPICCPSKEAVDAVLHAETSQGYMYFCASPEFDGTHRFAVSYKEHLANGRIYKAELDRRHALKLSQKEDLQYIDG